MKLNVRTCNIKLVCQPIHRLETIAKNALKGQTCVYLLMTIQEFILDLARLHGAQAGVEFAEFMYAKAFLLSPMNFDISERSIRNEIVQAKHEYSLTLYIGNTNI